MSRVPLRAFVSSTYLDVKHHRAHVIQALRHAGFYVDPMEDWTADPDEPKVFSQERVDGCDLCVLLVAFRRGHVPVGESLSITQLEYQRARQLGIDVLVFLAHRNAAWPPEYDERARDPDVNTWRSELQEHHGVDSFDLEPTSIPIDAALSRWVVKHMTLGAGGARGRLAYWMGRPSSIRSHFLGRKADMEAVCH